MLDRAKPCTDRRSHVRRSRQLRRRRNAARARRNRCRSHHAALEPAPSAAASGDRAPGDRPSGRCCSIEDVYDARHVAQSLGIPYYVVNFEQRFEDQVVKPFIGEYLAGRTPIPCTLCNNFIKFDQFLEMAEGVGASRIATGHYARIDFNRTSGRWELRRGVDHTKDQTYFLFGLTQDQLARALFPLGGMQKPEVRALARELQIPTADKPDSQEICFVPNGDYAAFIDAYFDEQGTSRQDLAGELITADGQVVGEHSGVHHFTVGQRRGLKVAAGEPLYVISTEPATRRVIIGRSDDLLRSKMYVNQVNWISIAPPAKSSPVSPCEPKSRSATSTPPLRRPSLPPARGESKSASMTRSARSLPARARYSTPATSYSVVVGLNNREKVPAAIGGWIE